MQVRQKIWDSGIGLSSWLVDLIDNVYSDPVNALKRMLLDSEPRKILELGIVFRFTQVFLSQYLARSGYRDCISDDRSHTYGFESQRGKFWHRSYNHHRSAYARPFFLVTTSLNMSVASAMPLLQQNISTNAKILSTSSCPEAVVLDWDKEIPETVKQERGFDMVVWVQSSLIT